MNQPHIDSKTFTNYNKRVTKPDKQKAPTNSDRFTGLPKDGWARPNHRHRRRSDE
ncbi:hypothetical protein ABH924_005086, partial [Arthrobacter sp. GAS37]